MDAIQVTYNPEQWLTLKNLREKAAEMMKPLNTLHIGALVYGSIARGDVRKTSDVDIFIPNPPSHTIIEATLERAGITFFKKEIVQATPGYVPKAYLYTCEKRSYSFPLTKMKPNEVEFYEFAGSLNYSQLKENMRTLGVDKRLMLIEPTTTGHEESSIKGREGEVASLLGVSIRIVFERIRTLERRERVGRTGVYVKRELAFDEDIYLVYNELLRTHAPMRRRIRGNKKWI